MCNFSKLAVYMSVRPILAAFLFAVPVISHASPALFYLYVYECDAVDINRDMVDMCSARFPDLSFKANEAFVAWRDRNLANADAARQRCARELDEESKNAPADRIQAFRTLIPDAKAEIHSNFQDQIREKGPAACLDAFDMLKNPAGTMNIRPRTSVK